MKENESRILEAYNSLVDDKLKSVPYEYCRFDAVNENYIAEIKDRNEQYKMCLIEFDKWAFNTEYAKIRQKDFLYIIRAQDNLYIFNCSTLKNDGYDFRWEWRKLPKTTAFRRKEQIQKYVGYIDCKEAFMVMKNLSNFKPN